MTSEARLGATGRAQAWVARFASVSVPSSDCVARCTPPLSFSCPDLHCGSADAEEAAPVVGVPAAQQTAASAARRRELRITCVFSHVRIEASAGSLNARQSFGIFA